MIPITVLSLDRSLDRRRQFIERNAGLVYEFHRATDGSLLSEQDIHDERLFIQPLHGIRSKTPGYRLLHSITKPLLPLASGLFPNSVLTTEDLGAAMLNAARKGEGRPREHFGSASAVHK